MCGWVWVGCGWGAECVAAGCTAPRFRSSGNGLRAFLKSAHGPATPSLAVAVGKPGPEVAAWHIGRKTTGVGAEGSSEGSGVRGQRIFACVS